MLFDIIARVADGHGAGIVGVRNESHLIEVRGAAGAVIELGSSFDGGALAGGGGIAVVQRSVGAFGKFGYFDIIEGIVARVVTDSIKIAALEKDGLIYIGGIGDRVDVDILNGDQNRSGVRGSVRIIAGVGDGDLAVVIGGGNEGYIIKVGRGVSVI